MDNHEIHKVVSDDGIEIVGKVMGEGSPPCSSSPWSG